MQTRSKTAFIWLLIGAVLLLGGVAFAAERLTSIPEPEDVDLPLDVSGSVSDESEFDEPSAEELQAASEAAAREQILRDTYGPQATHEDSLNGRGPTTLPRSIAVAVDADTLSVLTASDRLLVATEAIEQGGTRMESATYSDGKEIVELIWQTWPENVDLQAVLQQGTIVEQEGNLDITIRRGDFDNTIEVGVFDGTIYARLYTTFSEDIDVETAKALAMRLYEAAAIDK